MIIYALMHPVHGNQPDLILFAVRYYPDLTIHTWVDPVDHVRKTRCFHEKSQDLCGKTIEFADHHDAEPRDNPCKPRNYTNTGISGIRVGLPRL